MKNFGTHQPIDSSTAHQLECYSPLALWTCMGYVHTKHLKKSPDLSKTITYIIRHQKNCHLTFGSGVAIVHDPQNLKLKRETVKFLIKDPMQVNNTPSSPSDPPKAARPTFLSDHFALIKSHQEHIAM